MPARVLPAAGLPPRVFPEGEHAGEALLEIEGQAAGRPAFRSVPGFVEPCSACGPEPGREFLGTRCRGANLKLTKQAEVARQAVLDLCHVIP